MQAHWVMACVIAVMLASNGALAVPVPNKARELLQSSPHLHRIDVIGKDQRVRLPEKYKSIGKGIGIVFQPGGGWACTAFCVKPSVITTNAHCLFGRPGVRGAIKLDQIQFAVTAKSRGLRYRSSRLLLSDTKQPGLSIYSGYYRSRRSLLEFSNDWALAKLRYPICKGAELELAQLSPRQIAKEAQANRLSLIGYHGDKQMDGKWLSRNCRTRSTSDKRYLLPSQRRRLRRVDSLMLHTCDATRGASGSPLLVQGPAGPKVVAINAGTIGFTRYRRTRTGRRGRAVLSRATNVAVLSRTFADGLERFSSEKLLTSGKAFQRVQQLLGTAGLYKGPIDGLYGPASRSAIVRYERRHQMAALGVPTESLLQHLEKQAAVNAQPDSSNAISENATDSKRAPPLDEADASVAVSGRAPLVQRIQERLFQLGCYQGPIDGLWGPQSRRALRTALGLTKQSLPNSTVLEQLNVKKTQACR